MTRGRWILAAILTCGTLAWAVGSSLAQAPQAPAAAGGRPNRDQLTQPVFRVAQQQPQQPAIVANNTVPGPQPEVGAVPPQQHPLEPALQMAYAAMTNIRNNIKDYSCTMIKHERIGGKLAEPEYMYLKVRHEPFSVYMYFLGPERIRGQEAIYVDGQNNGNLLGHGVGIRKIAGTVPLQPTGAMAMQGQRYPITEIGMLNLTKRLVEVAEMDKNFGECDVKFFRNAKITTGKEKRPVTCIQVVHPIPRKNFRFHLARVYVDDELNLPIRYESYDWPEKPGGQPILLEEYTYTDVKLNNGFTDMDFSTTNPQYNFR
jgi:outer membrane lipoprotein-sorting protein